MHPYSNKHQVKNKLRKIGKQKGTAYISEQNTSNANCSKQITLDGIRTPSSIREKEPECGSKTLKGHVFSSKIKGINQNSK